LPGSPWGNGYNPEQHNFYKKLIRIRKEKPGVIHGENGFILSEGKALMYKRQDKKDQVLVLVYLGQVSKIFNLPQAGNYLNLLDNTEIKGRTMILPALSAAVLRNTNSDLFRFVNPYPGVSLSLSPGFHVLDWPENSSLY